MRVGIQYALPNTTLSETREVEMKAGEWSADEIMRLWNAVQQSCVLGTAVDYEVFDTLSSEPSTANGLAQRLGTDQRATLVLLNALVAMGVLNHDEGLYSVPNDVARLLTRNGEESMLAMQQHYASCLRRWVQLPSILKTGQPAERTPGVRGADADREAFIEGMNDISRRMAPQLVRAIPDLDFQHILDVGGGSGTWTMEFLRVVPGATATLFDLPEVIPMARRRLEREGFADRVDLQAGDFYADPLPDGADLVWLGAIVHQNSRSENRELFRKCHAATIPGGRILVRDIVMDDTHTHPLNGALFAINMLVATPGGGTYSMAELSEDLHDAGYVDVSLAHAGQGMDSIVRATKPKQS
jgi:SAM-dependent methyltransferase